MFRDILITIIKNAAHVYSHRLTIIFNNCIKEMGSSQILSLKYAGITPVFKKGDTTDKSNYKPINTLSNFSEIFEKLTYNQVNLYITVPKMKFSNFLRIWSYLLKKSVMENFIFVQCMEPKLSKYSARFRRNHNTQYALLKMIDSWRTLLNRSQKVGAIIMDLSEAFDTLNHKLLLKKLQAYGFDERSLSFIESYITNRNQRTKIGDSFRKIQRIITGVPQGSVLGPLFFNIFINDPFLAVDKSTLCNYADDNTLYTPGNDANTVIVS